MSDPNLLLLAHIRGYIYIFKRLWINEEIDKISRSTSLEKIFA